MSVMRLSKHVSPIGEMWSDILMKPQWGYKWKETQSNMMDISISYNKKVKVKVMGSNLLPRIDPFNKHSQEVLQKVGALGHQKKTTSLQKASS